MVSQRQPIKNVRAMIRSRIYLMLIRDLIEENALTRVHNCTPHARLVSVSTDRHGSCDMPSTRCLARCQ